MYDGWERDFEVQLERVESQDCNEVERGKGEVRLRRRGRETERETEKGTEKEKEEGRETEREMRKEEGRKRKQGIQKEVVDMVRSRKEGKAWTWHSRSEGKEGLDGSRRRKRRRKCERGRRGRQEQSKREFDLKD